MLVADVDSTGDMKSRRRTYFAARGIRSPSPHSSHQKSLFPAASQTASLPHKLCFFLPLLLLTFTPKPFWWLSNRREAVIKCSPIESMGELRGWFAPLTLSAWWTWWNWLSGFSRHGGLGRLAPRVFTLSSFPETCFGGSGAQPLLLVGPRCCCRCCPPSSYR